MNTHLSADEDYSLWVLLHQARDVIFRARENELRQYDVTTMQAAVLFVIDAIEGKATPTEISRWLLREPHTVSVLLTRMEKEGLVSKAKDPGKKGLVNVTLTEKGRQVLSQSMKRESIRKVMSCLSDEEREQLRSSLEKLRDNGLNNMTTVRKVPFP